MRDFFIEFKDKDGNTREDIFVENMAQVGGHIGSRYGDFMRIDVYYKGRHILRYDGDGEGFGL